MRCFFSIAARSSNPDSGPDSMAKQYQRWIRQSREPERIGEDWRKSGGMKKVRERDKIGGNRDVLPKKSLTSNVSSRPMRISRWILERWMVGMWEVWIYNADLNNIRSGHSSRGEVEGAIKQTTEERNQRQLARDIERAGTNRRNDLPFHQLAHRRMQPIHITMQVQLQVILRLLPLYTNHHHQLPLHSSPLPPPIHSISKIENRNDKRTESNLL